MVLKVRSIEQSDVDEVLRLYRSVGEWFEDIEVTRDYIISSSQRPDFRFMVAEDGGRVVGFIGALFFPLVGRAEIGPISVDSTRRGAGIGGAMMMAMVTFLTDEGIKRVYVKVKEGNAKAISFFIGMGFSYEAYLRNYTLDGESVVQLVRIL
jgi:[ribosomal protein S18]-alanine N-acetyltransferase